MLPVPRSELQQQYERFPYPPGSALSLPKRGQGQTLQYEHGTRLVWGTPLPHKGIRILVAGCGTLEALVVAEAHPFAQETVAVDLSASSIRKLAFRAKLAQVSWRKRSPLHLVNADLGSWEDGRFDYVLASNFLHHCEAPTEMLARLASWLKPEGILRFSTYPKASRIWMRKTSKWLRLHGLSAVSENIASRARAIVSKLPDHHPIRSCFFSQPEIFSPTGLVDAFLNALENPLSPLEWKEACRQAGLTLAAEGHSLSSQSSFLLEIYPNSLGTWERLQVLDDLLEICANPVFWMKQGTEKEPPDPGLNSFRTLEPLACDFFRGKQPAHIATQLREGQVLFQVPSRPRFEIAQGLRRIQAQSVSLGPLLDALRTEVGPRVGPPPDAQILPGLSVLDYPCGEILNIADPWSAVDWLKLEENLASNSRIYLEDGSYISGDTFAEQAEWLQLRYGPFQNSIGIRIRREIAVGL